jgi:hypothetical protein
VVYCRQARTLSFNISFTVTTIFNIACNTIINIYHSIILINLGNHRKPPKKSISLSFGGYSSGTWSYPSILTGVTGCIRCGSPSTTILVKLSAHERWHECKNQSCTVRYYKTIIATGESKIVELKDAAVNTKTMTPASTTSYTHESWLLGDMSELPASEELVSRIKFGTTGLDALKAKLDAVLLSQYKNDNTRFNWRWNKRKPEID